MVIMMVQSAQGLEEMESSAQVTDCLRQEEHLPMEVEEERRPLMGGGLVKDPGSHDVREQVDWEWKKWTG